MFRYFKELSMPLDSSKVKMGIWEWREGVYTYRGEFSLDRWMPSETDFYYYFRMPFENIPEERALLMLQYFQ